MTFSKTKNFPGINKYFSRFPGNSKPGKIRRPAWKSSNNWVNINIILKTDFGV